MNLIKKTLTRLERVSHFVSEGSLSAGLFSSASHNNIRTHLRSGAMGRHMRVQREPPIPAVSLQSSVVQGVPPYRPALYE